MAKNTEKMVAIKMGYDCIVMVPVSKSGPMLAILASCQICRSEWISARPVHESGSRMVLQDRKLEMEMGDFEPMTQDEYMAACAEAAAHSEALKLAELNAEAAPN